jgi:hypothetical protein
LGIVSAHQIVDDTHGIKGLRFFFFTPALACFPLIFSKATKKIAFSATSYTYAHLF